MKGNGIGMNLEISKIDGRKWNWKEPGNLKNKWKEPGNLKNRWKEMEFEEAWKSQK